MNSLENREREISRRGGAAARFAPSARTGSAGSGSIYSGYQPQSGRSGAAAHRIADTRLGTESFSRASYDRDRSRFSQTREARRIDARGKRAFRDVRREASRRRKFALRRRVMILGFTIALLFITLLSVVYKTVFRVTDISVSNTVKYSADEVIAASGIEEGVNLYSFRRSSVADSVTFNCPYISDIDIERNIPHSVVISTTEDEPAYSVSVFGEYKLLSEGLRVLGTADTSESAPAGLVRLLLPEISYSVAGRVISFSDSRYDRSVREVLSAVADSELSERITAVDMRDIYNISMTCDDKYKLIIGDTSRLEMKLLTAARVLEDDMFKTDNKMRIDLTADGKTGIIIDNKLELD